MGLNKANFKSIEKTPLPLRNGYLQQQKQMQSPQEPEQAQQLGQKGGHFLSLLRD